MTRDYDYLFISNGHGEDFLAAAIINRLRKINPSLSLAAYPLVGLGEAYEREKVTLLEPRQTLPSGGFSKGSLLRLFKDVKAGLPRLLRQQVSVLKKVAPKVKRVVVVGDFLPVFLSWLFLRRPLYFVATAKSDYIAAHWPIEVAMLRKAAVVVFARDELTASGLLQRGVRSVHMGNVMMDSLCFGVSNIQVRPQERTLLFLPGSRQDAAENLMDMLKITKKLKHSYNYLVAVSQMVSEIEFMEAATASGWDWIVEDGATVLLELKDRKIQVRLIWGAFGDLLSLADLVVGMSGTACEQAVGLGKPVITYPRNRQMARFLRDQKKLLGTSLFLMAYDHDLIAEFIEKLIDDESRLQRLAEAGKKRLGNAGGASKIARYLESESTA